MRGKIDAIISIRPVYAAAILAGSKTVELRRRVPKVAVGTRLWIYATRPVAALVGFATIKNVAKGRPTAIWRAYRAKTGVDYAAFKAYFQGADQAVGIELGPTRRVRPISLERLRCVRPHFHPPQVLMHLTSDETKALRELASFNLSLPEWMAPCASESSHQNLRRKLGLISELKTRSQ